MQNQRGGLPEARQRNTAMLGVEPQLPAQGCAVWLQGLLFLQWDPAYLGSSVRLDGELMLRAEREEGALRAQGAQKRPTDPQA